jgi:hypothetical protein
MFTESSAVQSQERMTKVYFKDDYATIEFDDSIPCIKLTLNGIPKSSEHYAEVQTRRLELMQQEVKNYPKVHMLTDSRTAGPVLEEDVSFFRDCVMPAMEKAGVKCLAIVMPKNKFTQLTIRDMTQNARAVTVRYFDSMREARNWLRKMTMA